MNLIGTILLYGLTMGEIVAVTHASDKTTNSTSVAQADSNPARHPFFYAGQWDTRKPKEQSTIQTFVKGTYGQFRHMHMTQTGTLLVLHLGENKVVEYDPGGNGTNT